MVFSPAALIPQWARTYAAVILTVTLAVNLITSFSLYVQALTIPGMKSSFELSYTTVFVLVVALSISRVVSGLTAGAVASRYGGKWMVICSIFVQAVSMGLLGWSPSYWVALVAMVAVGVSSGAALTPMMGMLARWFRATDRGVAAGIAASGGSLAIIFTGVIVPPLTGVFGEEAWRYTWYVLAAASVFIGLACVSFIREAPAADGDASIGSATAAARRSSDSERSRRLAGTGLYQSLRLADYRHGVLLRFRPRHSHVQLRRVSGSRTGYRRGGGGRAVHAHRSPQYRQRDRIRRIV